MKTLLKLMTLTAAAVVAYKAYEKKKSKKEDEKIINIDKIEHELPELVETSNLDEALVQSFKVQSKVMMDSYPTNHLIDIIHTITFKNIEQFNKFIEIIKELDIVHVQNLDNLSINLKQTIHTEAQEAFNSIIKIAELSLDKGNYQGWVFENLK